MDVGVLSELYSCPPHIFLNADEADYYADCIVTNRYLELKQKFKDENSKAGSSMHNNYSSLKQKHKEMMDKDA